MGRTVPAGCDRNGDPPGEKKEAPSSLCHFWLRAPRGFPLGLTFAPVRPPLARPTSVVPLSARRRIRHLAPVLPFGFARLDRSCRSEADGQHTGAPEDGQRQFLALSFLAHSFVTGRRAGPPRPPLRRRGARADRRRWPPRRPSRR